MGTACACLLAGRPENDVHLWLRNPTISQFISETRENSRLLPGIRIPESVQVTSDADAALKDAELVLICLPTRALRAALPLLNKSIPSNALLASAIKGIEQETLTRPSQIIQEFCGKRPVVVLGGPCHAEEAALGKPSSVVAAADRLEDAAIVQQAFSSSHFRVYSNTDVVGVELAGALKNVIAIAAGISDGLSFGDNAKSALITRGMAEMIRFGTALGADPQTFAGLAGIGDLIATCGSRHSRNRHVGELIGQGQSLEDIQNSMHAVAEGVFTARSVADIANQQNIEMPIAQEVFRVLFEGRSPRKATVELMERPLKTE
ncbi:UNVERIFIED_CONTAM: hypothetical protein GTU68_053195 [Idotea baltica]|nr:hypothetical protein [Idotea baltica]